MALRVVNGPPDMVRLRAAQTPVTDLTHSMLAHCQARLGRDFNHLHDPLALACAFDPRFVQFVESPVDIVTEEDEQRGVMPLLCSGAPKRLAREVDGVSFMDFFVERMIDLGKQLA